MKLKRPMLSAALVTSLAASVVNAAPSPPRGLPNPAACPAAPPIESDTNERKGALAVPSALSTVARSGRTNLAILTLTGTNYCHVISQVSEARNFALSPDRRFLSFDWYGYEEGGYWLIDRSGRGQSVDTGAKPVFAPSRRRMAAIEWSESGFGSLNGFAIWQVNAVGLRRTVMLTEIPPLADWRIDGWPSETCINLSGIPNSRIPEGAENYRGIARDRYVARPAGATWRITRATGQGCPTG